MNAKRVEEIANAVLYEGYMLYPYRASSVKNRQRWNFGVVYPQNYGDVQRTIDPWLTHTECLVLGNPKTEMEIKIRFLQAISRTLGELEQPIARLPEYGEPLFRPIGSLRVGEQLLQTWQEATERSVIVSVGNVDALVAGPMEQSFSQRARRDLEPVRDAENRITGLIVRTQEAIEGKIRISAVPVSEDVYRVRVTVANESNIAGAEMPSRDLALLQSLISAHSILHVTDGEFASLLETPQELREAAAECRNVGTWPVLVGDDGDRDAMLSSPIILYDYPQIAPESAGDLFDGTEIDEILALRILTLTEDEKREMREGDERARQVLERTEALPAEQFAKLHGTLRGLRPGSGDRG
jgi:hypothetical protein